MRFENPRVRIFRHTSREMSLEKASERFSISEKLTTESFERMLQRLKTINLELTRRLTTVSPPTAAVARVTPAARKIYLRLMSIVDSVEPGLFKVSSNDDHKWLAANRITEIDASARY